MDETSIVAFLQAMAPSLATKLTQERLEQMRVASTLQAENDRLHGILCRIYCAPTPLDESDPLGCAKKLRRWAYDGSVHGKAASELEAS